MRKIELYLAILIVSASIGGIMSLESGNLMYLVLALYVGVYLIGALRWIDEFRYYRRWNAPLASSMFVLIPLALGLSGSFLAIFTPILTRSIAYFTLDLNPLMNMPFVIFVSYFSLIFLLIPYSVSFFLMQRWLRLQYYPVFVFRRSVHPHVLLTVVLSVMMIHEFLTWREGYPLEGLEFLTISGLVILLIYRVSMRFLPFSRQHQRPSRVILPQNSLSSQASTRTSRATRASTRNDLSNRSNQTSRVTGPIARTRRPRTTIRSTSGQTRASSSSHSRSARANQGRSVTRAGLSERMQQHLSSAKKMRPILPRTRVLTKDDFNCMLCFQPPSKNDEPMVLCPHCHYPAHLSEWQEWHQSTDICSRCNEKIPKSYLKNPKHVVPAKVYMSWRKAAR